MLYAEYVSKFEIDFNASDETKCLATSIVITDEKKPSTSSQSFIKLWKTIVPKVERKSVVLFPI